MDGHLTEKILLEQGVPQGDIILPYIFKDVYVLLDIDFYVSQ